MSQPRRSNHAKVHVGRDYRIPKTHGKPLSTTFLSVGMDQIRCKRALAFI